MNELEHPDIKRALRYGMVQGAEQCTLCGADCEESQPLAGQQLCEECATLEQERIVKELSALLDENQLPFEQDDVWELVARSFSKLRHIRW